MVVEDSILLSPLWGFCIYRDNGCGSPLSSRTDGYIDRRPMNGLMDDRYRPYFEDETYFPEASLLSLALVSGLIQVSLLDRTNLYFQL